jgi:hypothetical protein
MPNLSRHRLKRSGIEYQLRAMEESRPALRETAGMGSNIDGM